MTNLVSAEEEKKADLERAAQAARGDFNEDLAGECECCGRWFSRLFKAACATCTEKYNLD